MVRIDLTKDDENAEWLHTRRRLLAERKRKSAREGDGDQNDDSSDRGD